MHNFKNFTLENVKSVQKFSIQSCSNGQNGSFGGLKMTKIEFPKILSSRKILIFSHCVGIQNTVGNTDVFIYLQQRAVIISITSLQMQVRFVCKQKCFCEGRHNKSWYIMVNFSSYFHQLKDFPFHY